MIRILVASCIVILSLPVTAGVITSLDFEDSSLPTTHGWTQIGSGNFAFITSNPDEPGLALATEGGSRWGYQFDLTGLVQPNDSWAFTADLKVRGGSAGDFDVGLFAVLGGDVFSNVPAHNQVTGGMTTLEMSYDSFTDLYTYSVDGVQSSPLSANSGSISWMGSNAIAFAFSNNSVVREATWDNVSFSTVPTPPALYLFIVAACAIIWNREKVRK